MDKSCSLKDETYPNSVAPGQNWSWLGWARRAYLFWSSTIRKTRNLVQHGQIFTAFFQCGWNITIFVEMVETWKERIDQEKIYENIIYWDKKERI